MYDIQVEISENLTLNNEVISKCIGLEKMKEMYNISGKVKHNALDDAIDLMKVVHAYKNYDYDPLILRKMYKEAMRKTFLWNYNFNSSDCWNIFFNFENKGTCCKLLFGRGNILYIFSIF